jgi:transcriptional regulator with XRE-family HTH domain
MRAMPASESPLLERIAANVRALRERRGLTREQLAATTHVDAQMIKRIEGGRANPALVVLSRLAATLMISLTLMLGAEIAADEMQFTNESEAEAFESGEVGDTLASLRKQRGVSQRALAQLVDLRTSTIHRYETGETDARVLELEPIARALDVEMIDLVRFIEQRHHQSEHATTQWSEPAPGVHVRVVSSGSRSQVWEWRLAPGAEIEEAASIGIAEDVVTMVRGRASVAIDGETHELHGGATLTLPADGARRFANRGLSTARLLRFQVRA